MMAVFDNRYRKLIEHSLRSNYIDTYKGYPLYSINIFKEYNIEK